MARKLKKMIILHNQKYMVSGSEARQYLRRQAEEMAREIAAQSQENFEGPVV